MGTFVATPPEELPKFWNKDRDGQSRHGTVATGKPNSKSVSAPDWFLPHIKQHFDDIPYLYDLMKAMVQDGEIIPHPQYEFGNIDKVHNGRVLLLGDAAHMASPRTAVGAHTAILDALALRESMQELDSNSISTIDEALQRYSVDGVARANQLYARSRHVSKEFVPDEIVSP